MDKDEFNKRFDGLSFSTSWTQPYMPTSYNPFYERRVPHSELTVQEELSRLDEIDDQVSLMNSYPDAEALLKNIFKY